MMKMRRKRRRRLKVGPNPLDVTLLAFIVSLLGKGNIQYWDLPLLSCLHCRTPSLYSINLGTVCMYNSNSSLHHHLFPW